MPPAPVVVDGEGIAVEDGPQVRIFFQLADRPRVCARPSVLGRGELGGASVRIELAWVVLCPECWVYTSLIQIDNPEASLASLRLPRGDVRVERHHQDSGERALCCDHSGEEGRTFESTGS